MSNVIESFMVKLGLDGSGFRQGTDEAIRDRERLAEATQRADEDTATREQQLSDDQARRGREAEARAKVMIDGFRKIRNEALSLFALFTAGVGIKNFISNTVESAVQLHYLSQNLKMSIETLQAYGRAAERMGGSTEGMFNQLIESADALAQLRSGMGPNEGMQWFFRMGGSSDDLADGNKYLMARAKIIHDMFLIDPTRARLISKNMGISDDLFDVIKQGPAAFEALAEAQRKNSAITNKDAAGALELKNKWLDFSQAMTATGTKILVALIPAFSQLMNWLQTVSGWITENKDLIGAWVTDFVTKAIPVMQKIGRFLADLDWEGAANRLKVVGDAIVKIAEALTTVIDLWNEWIGKKGETGKIGVKVEKAIDPKGELAAYYGPEEVAKDNARKKAGQESKYSSVDYFIKRMEARFGNQAAKEFIRDSTGVDEFGAGKAAPKVSQGTVLNKLVGLGWSKEQAAGIAGSLQQESQLNPAATNPKSGAYGIAQWLAPRRADFKAWAGKEIYGSTLDEQLAFQQYELTKGKERTAGDRLRATTTAADAARVHSEAYERPGAAEANIPQRQQYARDILGRVGASASPAATRGGPQTSTSTTDVKVGVVNIQTQATDAKGIAMAIGPAMREYSFSDQANTGFA